MKVYLAVPYTHENKDVVLNRVRFVNKVAARLIKIGIIVFSPISHSHYIAEQENLLNVWNSIWIKQDTEFINWCDVVIVCAIDGWGKSEGVKSEIEYAKRCVLYSGY
jgi:nucleoside 2-deoxyribosyltransferase